MEFESETIQGSMKTADHFLNEIEIDIKNEFDFKGTTSGYENIDKILGGFKKSTINIVTARTSVGKSNFCLNVARKLLKLNKKVMYIDLESQGKLNCLRLASMVQRKNLLKELQECQPGSPVYNAVSQEIQASRKKFNVKNLIYISKSGLTINQIQEEALGLDVDLLIIDHLQKIKVEHSRSRYERYADIAEDLRILTDNLGGIPLLVPAQLNRSAEGDSKPTSAQIKGAGDIEENADTVLTLSKKVDESGNLIDKIKIDVVKNRHGFVGETNLYFKRNWCLMEQAREW